MPNPCARRSRERLTTFAAEHSGHSTAIVRMILLEQPPSIDGQELTDKGSVNQKQVLANRADLVEQLYGAAGGRDPDCCGRARTTVGAGLERPAPAVHPSLHGRWLPISITV